MRSPELIYDILRAIRAAIDLPLTVKFRLGIDEGHINVLECSAAAEEAGVDAICIHGRTRAQLYSGKADMSEIRRVCELRRIPIFANGDISCALDAVRVLEETGADGLMIGRGAVGNPFIFSEIKAALCGKEYQAPTLDTITEVALRQLSYAISEKGEATAVKESRKQIASYFHTFRGSAELRAAVNRAESYLDVEKAIKNL
jgi:nifR3 family TIM-barrel protein